MVSGRGHLPNDTGTLTRDLFNRGLSVAEELV